MSGNILQLFEPLTQRTQFFLMTGVSSVWAALVLFDSAVFALTAYKGIRMWKNGYRGLPGVLLRDGVLLNLSINHQTNNLDLGTVYFLCVTPFTFAIATDWSAHIESW